MSEALKILQEFRENKRYSYMYDRIDTAIDGVLAKQEQENLTPRQGLAEYKKGYAKAELDLKREPLSDVEVLKIAIKIAGDIGIEHDPTDFEGTGVFELARAIEKYHGIGLEK